MGANLKNASPDAIWEDKASVVDAVVARVLQIERDRGRRDGTSLEFLIHEAIRQENEKQAAGGGHPRGDRKFWRRIAAAAETVSAENREEIVAALARRYAEEIHGTFNPVLYHLAARVLAWFLKLLLNRLSPAGIFSALFLRRLNLEETLKVSGPVETIRALAERGTLVLVPTHVSNLDSIVVGLGLYRAQLPPFSYGAGLNLFGNPLLAFFMNQLGAYKVDRRKKNTLYKDTLKQYATLSMESGRHHLIFPGGTRNRRGDVEVHLKLGLLGCALEAYIDNLRRGSAAPDFFVVPAALSYGVVLEAKPLIEEYLRAQGQSRFFARPPGLSRPLRWLRFWRNLQSLNSQVHLHFGAPIDLFGNTVDAAGVSRDRQARPVERARYVAVHGAPAPSPQRDHEYIRALGGEVAGAFLRCNTVLCTQAAAFAAFSALRAAADEADFSAFLRRRGRAYAVPRTAVLGRLQALVETLRRLEAQGGVRLEDTLRTALAPEVFAVALAQFRSYHDRQVLREEKDRVYSLDLKLLYYYRNRLEHYGLAT